MPFVRRVLVVLCVTLAGAAFVASVIAICDVRALRGNLPAYIECLRTFSVRSGRVPMSLEEIESTCGGPLRGTLGPLTSSYRRGPCSGGGDCAAYEVPVGLFVTIVVSLPSGAAKEHDVLRMNL